MSLVDSTDRPACASVLSHRIAKVCGAGAAVALFVVMLHLVSCWVWDKTTVWNGYRSRWAVERAMEQLAAGNQAGGQESLEHAIQLDPRNAEAYVRRASLHWESHNHPAAVADLLTGFKYARSDAMRAHVCLTLGFVQSDRGHQLAAKEAFDKALEYEPTMEDAFWARGMAHRLSGDMDAAIADLNRAIRLQPGCADAYAQRSVVHLQQENRSQALQDAEQAISLGGDVPEAHAVRGRVHLERENHQEAIADLSIAILHDPTQAAYFEWRAAAYQAIGAEKLAETDRVEANRLRALTELQ